MAVIDLPGKTVDYVGLIRLMTNGAASMAPSDAPLVFRVADRTFITTSALTWLCALPVTQGQGCEYGDASTRRAIGEVWVTTTVWREASPSSASGAEGVLPGVARSQAAWPSSWP